VIGIMAARTSDNWLTKCNQNMPVMDLANDGPRLTPYN
jgi:hypothetical protein